MKLIQRMAGIILVITGLIMIMAGIWHFEKIHLAHILFGIVAFLAGCYLLIFSESIPFQDENTGYCYRYVDESENPHHAPCPQCGENSPLIITIYSIPHIRGVDCPRCGIVWFARRKKEKQNEIYNY